MKRSDTITLRDFERACDELFDEWLGRWRGGAATGVSAGAVVVDRGEEYEVRVEAAVEDPKVIDVEISEAGLIVRIPSGAHPAVERQDDLRATGRSRTYDGALGGRHADHRAAQAARPARQSAITRTEGE